MDKAGENSWSRREARLGIDTTTHRLTKLPSINVQSTLDVAIPQSSSNDFDIQHKTNIVSKIPMATPRKQSFNLPEIATDINRALNSLKINPIIPGDSRSACSDCKPSHLKDTTKPKKKKMEERPLPSYIQELLHSRHSKVKEFMALQISQSSSNDLDIDQKTLKELAPKIPTTTPRRASFKLPKIVMKNVIQTENLNRTSNSLDINSIPPGDSFATSTSHKSHSSVIQTENLNRTSNSLDINSKPPGDSFATSTSHKSDSSCFKLSKRRQRLRPTQGQIQAFLRRRDRLKKERESKSVLPSHIQELLHSRDIHMKQFTDVVAKRKGLNALNITKQKESVHGESSFYETEQTTSASEIITPEPAKISFFIRESEFQNKEIPSWAATRINDSINEIRFERPSDLNLLKTLTPLGYLSRFTRLSREMKRKYNHIFKAYTSKDGKILDSINVFPALNKLFAGDLGYSNFIIIEKHILNFEKDKKMSPDEFYGICAFCERRFWSLYYDNHRRGNYSTVKSIKLRCPVLEYLDFNGLDRKLENKNVSPELRTVLYSLI